MTIIVPKDHLILNRKKKKKAVLLNFPNLFSNNCSISKFCTMVGTLVNCLDIPINFCLQLHMSSNQGLSYLNFVISNNNGC